MINKTTGSYYTPEILSDFLTKHIFSSYLAKDDLSILEPSCGDGQFIKSLVTQNVLTNITGKIDIVDINLKELKKAKEFTRDLVGIRTVSSKKDFLDFKKKGYDLIIGNPPYISKKLLNIDQIEKCKTICQEAIKGYGETKNIWPSFLIKSTNILSADGVLCFVLPSELLQVKYAQGIREFLLKKFQRIEVFSFNELIFDGSNGKKIEQDVVALICVKKHEKIDERGVSFFQVEKLEDLKIPDYTEKNFNVHRKKLNKWTNYVLDDSELDFIDDMSKRNTMKPFDFFCQRVEVGIVTAANKYFILNKDEIRKNKLGYFSAPIIQKGTQLQNKISINQNDYINLKDSNKAVSLVRFSNKNQKSSNALKYIDKGEKEKLNLRYKMKLRKNWFHIPSVWKSEAFFMKRTHEVPRVVLNNSDVYVTDSFYRIVSKEETDIKSLVFSFNNSITFTLAELEGRYYGGGVLELIPSEFKKLLVPYRNITFEQFNKLDSLYREKKSLNEILNYTDSILLPEMKSFELKKIQDIRSKLLNRRMKINK